MSSFRPGAKYIRERKTEIRFSDGAPDVDDVVMSKVLFKSHVTGEAVVRTRSTSEGAVTFSNTKLTEITFVHVYRHRLRLRLARQL